MSDRLTDAELDELERLEREATPGDWAGFTYGILHRSEWVVSNAPTGEDEEIVSQPNADLIAAARNALPRLLAEIRELRKVIAKRSRRPAPETEEGNHG